MDHRPSLPSARRRISWRGSRRRRPTPLPSALGRRLTSLSVALLLAVGILAVPTAMPAAATDPYTVAGPTGGDGSNEAQAIVYTITFTSDCTASPTISQPPRNLTLNAVNGKHYRITFDGDNSCLSGIGDASSSLLSGSPLADNRAGASIGVGQTTTTLPLDLKIGFSYSLNAPVGFSPSASIIVKWTSNASQQFLLIGEPATGSQTQSGSSSSSAPDPTAGAVSVAAEQVAAAGVAGSSGAVRVRGGAPVAVSATVVPSVGPRGGVVVEGDGMRVAVASTLGASTGAGVRAPSGGLVDVSVSGPLTPGAVIEVWVRSEPRLVAAAAVPADYEDGDAVAFTVPLATPLDGGEAVEDGEHTLELRMYTADGFEVIATGLTVGSIAPTSIPAGEGPAVPSSLIGFGLLAAAGAVLVVRRQAVAG